MSYLGNGSILSSRWWRLVILGVSSVVASLVPISASAQECVTAGGCAGDVESGMCGTSADPIETGTGCNGVKNCQDRRS
jgi:hypothetical protein